MSGFFFLSFSQNYNFLFEIWISFFNFSFILIYNLRFELHHFHDVIFCFHYFKYILLTSYLFLIGLEYVKLFWCRNKSKVGEIFPSMLRLTSFSFTEIISSLHRFGVYYPASVSLVSVICGKLCFKFFFRVYKTLSKDSRLIKYIVSVYKASLSRTIFFENFLRIHLTIHIRVHNILRVHFIIQNLIIRHLLCKFS